MEEKLDTGGLYTQKFLRSRRGLMVANPINPNRNRIEINVCIDFNLDLA